MEHVLVFHFDLHTRTALFCVWKISNLKMPWYLLNDIHLHCLKMLNSCRCLCLLLIYQLLHRLRINFLLDYDSNGVYNCLPVCWLHIKWFNFKSLGLFFFRIVLSWLKPADWPPPHSEPLSLSSIIQLTASSHPAALLKCHWSTVEPFWPTF